LLELRSDPTTGHLAVKGRAGAADAGEELVVWTPTAAGGLPLTARGLVDVVSHPVAGGRLITATVAAPGDYALFLGPADPEPPTTTTAPGDATPPGAAPVEGQAGYTG
jgi:hypothetical protein